MATKRAATAVAPQVNGKDVATHAITSIGKGLHIGFTVLADIAKFGTAHAVHMVDKSKSVVYTSDIIDANTNIILAPYRAKALGAELPKARK